MENTNTKTITIRVPDYTGVVETARTEIREYNEHTAQVKEKNILTTDSIKAQISSYFSTLVAPLFSLRDFSTNVVKSSDLKGIEFSRITKNTGLAGVCITCVLNCEYGDVPYYPSSVNAIIMRALCYTDGHAELDFRRDEKESLATMIKAGRWPAIKESSRLMMERIISATVAHAKSAAREQENLDSVLSTFEV